MRQPTRLMTSVAVIIVATAPAAMFAIGAGTATAAPDTTGGTRVPLSGILRNCDFSPTKYATTHVGGTAFALITKTASNRLVAEVQLATAEPNTQFEARLIQVPRPASSSCGVGDPGTVVTALNTDAAGVGTVTLQDDLRPGATGAWVLIERPNPFSQTPAEVYTSDFVASHNTGY
jgi:hypothetical protein